MTIAQLLRRTGEGSRGEATGITSICSAHPLVLAAAIEHAARNDTSVLIEATCNQVNHRGGYTGMQPADFAGRVHAIADKAGLDKLLAIREHGANQDKITGTPAFLINGELAEGVFDINTLSAALDKASGG